MMFIDCLLKSTASFKLSILHAHQLFSCQKGVFAIFSAEAGMTSGNLDQFETKVQLNSDGLNTWYAPTILRSRCNIDITYFPFDEQRCVFRFGSWTYDGLKVDLHNMSATVDLAAYMPSGEFQMIEAPVKRVVVTYR